MSNDTIDIELYPSSFRMARKPDGSLVFQGGHRWQSQARLTSGVEWRDVPVVDIDENGKEI